MNDQEHAEFQEVKERCGRLQQDVNLLAADLSRLERAILASSKKAAVVPLSSRPTSPGAEVHPTAVPVIIPPPIIPRPPDPMPQKATEPAATRKPLHVELKEERTAQTPCAHCGMTIDYAARQEGWTIRCPHCHQPTILGSSPTTAGEVPLPPRLEETSASRPTFPAATAARMNPPPTPTQTAPERSFEMRLGTYWLVRIGIAMVLTALVFFGNLAYQNYISKLGPGGKVTLLYLCSAGLLFAGAWWQRKGAKESLKNYGQVLFAGGLAAVYFTTYAAHHVERLRIITSAQIDGLLLLAWAAFMVWVADRKKSEVLALFAVGLAYYTSIITHVGHFTLYSNLVLTLAAVFFLVRNRWATLTYGSLVATYVAYVFWRFHGDTGWHWAAPGEGLWSGVYFLASYWLVFTSAVFLSRQENLAGQNRATFITLNNAAFFAGFVLTMLQVREGGFWKFCLIYGAVLLVLAEAARRFLANEPLSKNAYLTQGLLLLTVGFISKYTGLELALILAMESVILLVLGQQRNNLVLQVGAYIAAGLSVAWAIDGMTPLVPSGAWLGSGLTVLMLVNTWFADRHSPLQPGALLRARVGYFVVASIAMIVVTAWNHVSHVNFPLVLLAAGVVFTFSFYLLRIPEITLFGQALVLGGQIGWLFYHLTSQGQPALGGAVFETAATLGLIHWWQRQKTIAMPIEGKQMWLVAYGVILVTLVYTWLRPGLTPAQWLGVASLLAIGITAYCAVTRAWILAACAQLYTGASVFLFVGLLIDSKPAAHLAAAPIAALAILSVGAVLWLRRHPANPNISTPVLQLARMYRWIALGLTVWWVCKYAPPREQIWILALLGLWFFMWAGWRQDREALLYSAGFTIPALVLFWLPLVGTPTVYFPNLLAVIVLLAQRQVARRLPERYPVPSGVHGAVIVIGGLSLWLFLSRWVLQSASGFYLTASWSALALILFTAGIVLKERVYRWLGLAILACALGRVIVFDLIKLEPIYRILSFMALGIVLLVLGFIYNKYQDKIRQWL